MQAVVNEYPMSTSKVLKVLNIPAYKLDYLFKSRKLKSEGFATLDNGHRLYYESDIPRIKEALYRTQNK